MTERESIADRAGLLAWLKEQGYWLEHVTAAALHGAGLYPALGRVYRDPATGKLRDIDVVGEFARPKAAIRLLAAFECKAGRTGAWIVRQGESYGDYKQPVPLLTDRAGTFVAKNVEVFTSAFPVSDPIGFSLMVAGKGSAAYEALQQAVGSALGMVRLGGGSTLVYPVLVVSAPLFTLTYQDDKPDPREANWARILFSPEQLDSPTLVDVVQRDALDDYLSKQLLPAFERFSGGLMRAGWTRDQ